MSDLALPSHPSVVLIGGGVMGYSTLYHLAEAGVSDAILLERNRLTSGTKWHSAAQVRALRSTRNLTDLIRYSISLYAKLEQETGQATGWINKGSLSAAGGDGRADHDAGGDSAVRGAFFRSMAVVLVFGLGFATLLTLVVVPALYSVFFGVGESERAPA